MDIPETRYVRTADAHIGYQVFGEGPIDLVFVAEATQNLDLMWDHEPIAEYLRGLTRIGRVICIDRRGAGISDPIAGGKPHTLESSVDDTRAVLDAVGSREVVVLGDGHAGPVAIMFVATYPERIRALVLQNTYARFLRDENYPAGLPIELVPRLLGTFERSFGNGLTAFALAPTIAPEEAFRAWWAKYERLCISPTFAVEMFGRHVIRTDVRAILPTIRIPTLVLHRKNNEHVRPAHGRYLAEMIPNAVYRELEGRDHLYHVGDSEAFVDEMQEFLTGVRETSSGGRMLATVMFTDIVGSTERTAELGDRRWRELLEAHNALIRGQLARFRGKEVNTTGDGFLATFDGPARAIRCAHDIAREVQELGLEIRAGVHTGECERLGSDVSGIAVDIAQRVMSIAEDGEVLVSSTVRDLVVGSGIEFDDRGSRVLKGVPGQWNLFAVTAT